MVVRPNLARELDLTATQRPAGPEASIPRAKEAQQLPDAVDPQTTGLYGVAAKVTLEEPVVDRHVAFRNDTAPGALGSNLENPIDHQHGRSRELHVEFGRRIGEEIPVCEGEQLLLRKALLLLKLQVIHEISPNRIR
jgi:hypothetical protein